VSLPGLIELRPGCIATPLKYSYVGGEAGYPRGTWWIKAPGLCVGLIGPGDGPVHGTTVLASPAAVVPMRHTMFRTENIKRTVE
jgi:hypothetical protein